MRKRGACPALTGRGQCGAYRTPSELLTGLKYSSEWGHVQRRARVSAERGMPVLRACQCEANHAPAGYTYVRRTFNKIQVQSEPAVNAEHGASIHPTRWNGGACGGVECGAVVASRCGAFWSASGSTNVIRKMIRMGQHRSAGVRTRGAWCVGHPARNAGELAEERAGSVAASLCGAARTSAR